MNTLKEYCQHYDYNYNILFKEFPNESSFFLKAITLTTLLTKRKLNIYIINAFYELITTSSKYELLRGDLDIAFSISLSQRETKTFHDRNNIPLNQLNTSILDNANTVYKIFQHNNYPNHNYIVVTAYTLSLVLSGGFRKYVDAGNKICIYAKEECNQQVFDEDYIYKTLISILHIAPEKLFYDTSFYNQTLYNLFEEHVANNIGLMLSHKYKGSMDSKLSRFLILKASFEKIKVNFNTSNQVIAISILSLHDVPIDTIIKDFTFVMKEIGNYHAFGRWSASREDKSLFAISILSFYYLHTESHSNFIFPNGMDGIKIVHSSLIAMLVVHTIAINRIPFIF